MAERPVSGARPSSARSCALVSPARANALLNAAQSSPIFGNRIPPPLCQKQRVLICASELTANRGAVKEIPKIAQVSETVARFSHNLDATSRFSPYRLPWWRGEVLLAPVSTASRPRLFPAGNPVRNRSLSAAPLNTELSFPLVPSRSSPSSRDKQRDRHAAAARS